MIRSLTSTCIVLLCFFASVATLPRKEVHGVLHGQITFKAIHETVEIKSIVWKFTRGRDTVKVVDWEPEFGVEEFGQFKSRVFLNKATGDLTVRDLTAQDTGRFVVDINSKELETSYNLVNLIERVPKPTIKHRLSEKNENTGYLDCEASTSTDKTFTWEDGNGTQLETGHQLTIYRSDDLNKIYVCVVKNPASEARSDPIKGKDVFPPEPEPGPVPIWLIILLIIIVIIVIIVVMLFCIIPYLFTRNQQLRDSLTNSENSFIKGYRRLLDRIIGPNPHGNESNNVDQSGDHTGHPGESSKNKDAEKGDSKGGASQHENESNNVDQSGDHIGRPAELIPLLSKNAGPNTGPNPHGNESNNVDQSGDHTGPRGESSENEDAEKGDSTGGPNPHGNESNNVDQSGDHTGASQHEKESNNVDQSGDHTGASGDPSYDIQL